MLEIDINQRSFELKIKPIEEQKDLQNRSINFEKV